MSSKWFPLITSLGIGTIAYMAMARDVKSQSKGFTIDETSYDIQGPCDTRTAN